MHRVTVPARYAPELIAAIAAAVRTIEADAALRDGEAPFAHGFIEPDRIDPTRAGELVITIEEQPAARAATVHAA